MLAIFDIDGTLCDSEGVDTDCYARAIGRVTGRSLSSLDWSAYAECTATAIIREMFAGDGAPGDKEDEIERVFVGLLKEEKSKFPGTFLPLNGAVRFLERLGSEGICPVAIATGCFCSSARFKLRSCGIALDDYPHATSSDTPRRADILSLAASRAGVDLSSAVYFGDGPWDVRASASLGIPLIGIGRGCERLRELGVRHAFPDYADGDAIIRALKSYSRQGDSADKP